MVFLFALSLFTYICCLNQASIYLAFHIPLSLFLNQGIILEVLKLYRFALKFNSTNIPSEGNFPSFNHLSIHHNIL